jgi:hypothetical protein
VSKSLEDAKESCTTYSLENVHGKITKAKEKSRQILYCSFGIMVIRKVGSFPGPADSRALSPAKRQNLWIPYGSEGHARKP